jgi:MFS family permease
MTAEPPSLPPYSDRPHTDRSAPTPGWLAPFRVREFRWLYASNLCFFLAMQAQITVRSWLVFDLTDSAAAVGLLAGAVALPMLLVGPLGGVIADRLERRRLIALGQALILGNDLLLLVAMLLDAITLGYLIVAATVMGVALPLVMPARQAIVSDLVGRASFGSAFALNMGAMNASRVLGPASAGLIYVAGVEVAYGAGVLLYVIALVCLLGVMRRPSAPADVPLMANFVEGARYVAQTRVLLMLLLFGIVPLSLAMPFQQLLVVFAEQVFEAGPLGFALLNTTAGLGGVVGAVYVARRGNDTARIRLMVTSMLGFSGSLLLFCAAPSLWPALPLALCATTFASVFGALNNTAIQLIVPDAVRGRVSSFLMMSVSVPLLGTVLVGRIAEWLGPRVAVSGAAVLAVVVVALFYLASAELRRLDLRLRAAVEADLRAELPPSTALAGD